MKTRCFSQPRQATLFLSPVPRSVPFLSVSAPTSIQARAEQGAGLHLPFQHGRRWIALPQIIRLEGVGNYTTCYFLDGSQLLVARSLKVLANRLPAEAFLRPHRKHLLNPQYIETISTVQLLVMLTNGERVPLARRRVTGFRREWRGNERLSTHVANHPETCLKSG